MAKLTLKDGRIFEVEAGLRLVLALKDNDVDILHRCGGHAKCTTCRVSFLEGEPTRMTEAEKERLEARDLLGQARLSCQILTDGDMRLEPLNTISNSDLDDAGPRPEDNITPDPVWIDAP
ncbi:MAG: (2Fe-2S)-binding protein [Chloroflexi bacterium]|nr:(2Fe-2S)-binding protein [Chloroflexota bacterium]